MRVYLQDRLGTTTQCTLRFDFPIIKSWLIVIKKEKKKNPPIQIMFHVVDDKNYNVASHNISLSITHLLLQLNKKSEL